MPNNKLKCLLYNEEASLYTVCNNVSETEI
jgi:hypothetical protein